MNYKAILKIFLRLFIVLVSLFLVFLLLALCAYPPDIYWKLRFKNEIKEYHNIKKITSFKYVPNFWDKFIYEVGLELPDNKRILLRLQMWKKNNNIDIHGIIEIENYIIEVLELNNSGTNAYLNWDGIYYTGGLQSWLLEIIINKPDEYFSNLYNYINDYDEIKEIIEKIYNEERLSGSKDDTGRGDIDKWGNDEEFMKYTGYVIFEGDNRSRAKIYVDLNNKKAIK